MTTINKYRIYCNIESDWVYVWSETVPTTCPNNTIHNINPDSISIVETLSTSEITIKEIVIPPNQPSINGSYRIMTRGFDCAGNTTTEYTWSYPYPLYIMSGYMHTNCDQKGDIIGIEVNKNVTVGVLTANVTSGSTVLNVNSTVVNNIINGYRVKITNGVTSTEFIDVTSVNKNNSTITLSTGITSDFNAGAYIKMTIIYCDNFELSEPGKYTIGNSTSKGTYLPSNTVVTFSYKNNNSILKRPVFIIDLYY